MNAIISLKSTFFKVSKTAFSYNWHLTIKENPSLNNVLPFSSYCFSQKYRKTLDEIAFSRCICFINFIGELGVETLHKNKIVKGSAETKSILCFGIKCGFLAIVNNDVIID